MLQLTALNEKFDKSLEELAGATWDYSELQKRCVLLRDELSVLEGRLATFTHLPAVRDALAGAREMRNGIEEFINAPADDG
jgi:hypothetical protein